MERKLWLCLDCHAVFYDGENHVCTTIDKSHFILKPWVGNKHAEGIYGSICNVQYNSVGQRERLNYPAAFFSFHNVEMQLHTENLQNVSRHENSYDKVQQREHRVFSTSEQNETFNLSMQSSHVSSLIRNAENSVAYDWMSYVPCHSSDTREETINYFTMPYVSAPAHELKKFSVESSKEKSIIPHYTLTQVLYEQEGVQGSSEESYAMTAVSNQNLLLNTNNCKPESHLSIDKRNILPSTNILATNRDSQSFDFLPVQRDGDRNKAPQLPSLLQVNYRTCDIGRNNLNDKDVPLMYGSDDYHIAGPSHRNVEAYSELEDGRLLCLLCRKICNSKGVFVVHYRRHTGERPFACEKCPKRFMEKKQLTKHYKIHFEEKLYPCNMCESRFFTKKDLDKHHEIHSVERPYACDKCTKRFYKKEKLKRHLQIHTGERPFPCGQCGKNFASKGIRDSHRRTHITD